MAVAATCSKPPRMLGNNGPAGATNTPLGLTINRDWSAIMAKACVATNPPVLKPRSGKAALTRRFAAKVDTGPGHGPNGDCHIWTGRVDGRGYGEIKIGGRYKKAHRLALFGLEDIGNPAFACHRCDNPPCVNEAHLFASDAKGNVGDMHSKGRAPVQHGGNGRSARKLSNHDVLAIRSSTSQARALARKYGVDEMVIHRVRRRETYKHVP